jgi:hypothetical protein
MNVLHAAWFAALVLVLSTTSALAYDCSGLPEWRRQHYYPLGAQVQYEGIAYENTIEGSKRDRPDRGDPWISLGACDGSSDPGGDVDPQPLSIFGVWHCGNTFCDWSQVRDMADFHHANSWIVEGNNGQPSVNLVVLSFLHPMHLLNGTNDGAFVDGIPAGMRPEIVDYFASRGIRVFLSMGGVTYTDAWDAALATDPAGLAQRAAEAVALLNVDGFEIDYENGTPTEAQMAALEVFIDTFNSLSDVVLTLDLGVGTRYLQELSRRAAADWLPNGRIDYINAMVPRGDPSTDQWQEHVDGKSNYNPPILPKPPAKIAVSLWLTDSRRANDNCIDFSASSQLEKADYVQKVQPNGAGITHGLLGYMFWAAECPSSRNVCTTPPNTCEGGMGEAAAHFEIPVPLDFGLLRQE